MFLKNASFFCRVIIFSGVKSGRDINSCSNCGISFGDALSRDTLDSSGFAVGKVFCAL